MSNLAQRQRELAAYHVKRGEHTAAAEAAEVAEELDRLSAFRAEVVRAFDRGGDWYLRDTVEHLVAKQGIDVEAQKATIARQARAQCTAPVAWIFEDDYDRLMRKGHAYVYRDQRPETSPLYLQATAIIPREPTTQMMNAASNVRLAVHYPGWPMDMCAAWWRVMHDVATGASVPTSQAMPRAV